MTPARLHTDREILRCIFDMYESRYPEGGDPYLPIDVRAVAERLGCKPHLLFGRLHHDLSNRFRYNDDDARTSLFEMQVGGERHCVNFPYLVAVLADKQSQHSRERWALLISVAALIVAIVSAAFKFAVP